jgi:predicted transcriptional regulator
MDTRLERFLRTRGIKPAHLARESGYSRQHLLRIRLGRMDPTRRCMVAVTLACRRLSGEHVTAAELFNLEGEDE